MNASRNTSKKVRQPEWKQFEKLVYAIQKFRFKNAEVVLDDSVPDRNTKKSRQVDIAIRFTVGSINYFVVIECKNYRTRAIDQPRVEQFASFIKSVGADSGIMVGSSGYSESAKIYADAMSISLFTAREAETVEWEKYLLEATRPVIKKRILVGDVMLISNNRGIRISTKGSLNPDTTPLIYRRDGNDIIPMSEYRKRHRESDFDNFMNMPDVYSFLVELTCEQVETKLDTSRAAAFNEIREQIVKETGRKQWEIRTIHLFYDSLNEISPDTTALIKWTAEVWFPPSPHLLPPHMLHMLKGFKKRVEDYFVRFSQELVPLHGLCFRYCAEITTGRFRKDDELSERDLSSGIVYVDHNEGKREFFFLSHLVGN